MIKYAKKEMQLIGWDREFYICQCTACKSTFHIYHGKPKPVCDCKVIDKVV